MAGGSADLEREWLLRGKWDAFYDGTYAPHLISNSDTGTIEQLPWRSGKASTQLLDYLAQNEQSRSHNQAAIELGCGTGENLVCLASVFGHVTGVDVSAVAVHASREALAAAGRSARVIEADVLALPDELRGAFDFVVDCQTFQCVRKVDEDAAAASVVSLLKPNGVLLLMTGNADELAERGPERLTREDLDRAFASRGLICEACAAFRFDWTEAYRRQPFSEPPLGWCSIWRQPGPLGVQRPGHVANP
jgi:SAM-dependent methyltransferase